MMTKDMKIQIPISEFAKNDKFIDQNRKNHGRHTFHFLIKCPILDELPGHKIPHSKAF